MIEDVQHFLIAVHPFLGGAGTGCHQTVLTELLF